MLTPQGGQPVLYENYTGELIDWEEFFRRRDKDIDLMKNGSAPESCRDCLWIRENDWDERKKEFKYILLNIWVKCNLKCIYCSNHKDTYVSENTKPYNIVPVLKDMIEKGYITQNTKIDIAGGESTLDCNFHELINLLIQNGIKNINLNTNATNYIEEVKNGIEKGFISIITSVDAGSSRYFKYIKKADLYSVVWKNLQKYAQAKKIENSNSVKAKYIIIPDVNDNKAQIRKFILKAKKSGVQGVICSTDLHWILHNPDDKKTMLKTINLTKYFINICSLIGIDWQIWAHIEDLIKRYNLIENENKIDIDFIYKKQPNENKKNSLLKILLYIQNKLI